MQLPSPREGIRTPRAGHALWLILALTGMVVALLANPAVSSSKIIYKNNFNSIGKVERAGFMASGAGFRLGYDQGRFGVYLHHTGGREPLSAEGWPDDSHRAEDVDLRIKARLMYSKLARSSSGVSGPQMGLFARGISPDDPEAAELVYFLSIYPRSRRYKAGRMNLFTRNAKVRSKGRSASIRRTGKVNKLRLVVNGARIKGYVNGRRLFSFRDLYLAGGGYFGFRAEVPRHDTARWQFDDMVARTP